MGSSFVLTLAAMVGAVLAAPQVNVWPSSSPTKPDASEITQAGNEPVEYFNAQVPNLVPVEKAPNPTPAAKMDEPVSEDTASWMTIITSIIIDEGGPDSWLPFSWGPWMLPPLEDITCSVTSSSVPNWDSPDFPWIIPPRNHIRTEAATSTSTAPLAQWTESAPGSWGFQPRDGVICVGTSSTSTFSPVPIWGGGGTSFFWGLPPRDDQVSTDSPMAMSTPPPSALSTVLVTILSTATLAPERPRPLMSDLASQHEGRGGTTAALRKQIDVATVAGTGIDVVTSMVVSGKISEPDTPPSLTIPSQTEAESKTLPLTTSHKAISTLSATQGPDLVTASSAWVDGLPPPIPFDSIIIKTLTLDIPSHGTNVADSSTWFGPWPSSTELPFVTSPIITTPTTFLTLPKTTTNSTSASTTSSSSIKCNEEYCGEDGTS